MTASPRIGQAELAAWELALEDGTFEEVFAALEEVVGRLEEGRLPLAESVACFELGVRLARRCDRMLDEADLRVSTLDVGADLAFGGDGLGEPDEDDDAGDGGDA